MILSALLASALLLPVLPVLPCLTAGAEEAEDFETRKTPIMGWASWNCYRTDISEEAILSQARKLKELGLADLGYVFVNVDDGWQYGRGEDGYVRTNEKRFPSGMKYLCDTIHALGLKAGIYTDAGALTCGWCSDNQTENDDVGLWGHDESDLRRYFIDWDYDFIKVDWCGGVRAGLSTRTRYTEIGKVINKIEKEIGKDKIYNVCCWGFPGEWVVNVADSWRTGGDIFNNFGAVIEQIDNIKSLAKYTGPGHVNDLDMMQIGNGMSYEEDKSHFAMWCMMSTPLMLGNDLNSISSETLSIISNSELIALDQDPACLQATVVKNYGAVEAWAKDLGEKNSDVKAFALLNRSEKPQTLNVSFEELGLEGVTTVRDLWAHSDLSVDGRLRVTVPAHGTAVFRAAGTHKDVEAFTKTIPDTDDGSVVAADCAVSVEKKPGALNLTKTGKADWIHTGNTVTRMKDGAGEISYGYDGSFCTYGNAAARYVWTNGEEQPRSTGDTSGIGVLGGGAYVYVSVPCDANPRTLSAAFGSYSADMRIRVIVGGKTIHEEVIPGGANRKEDRLVTATVASDVPTTAYFVADVVKSLGASDSVNLEAAALNISVKKCILGNVGIVPTETGDLLKIPAASCVDNASIIVVLRDGNNYPVRFTTIAAEKDRQKLYTVDASFTNGFTGRADVYFWQGNKPLDQKRSVVFDAQSLSDRSIGKMAAGIMLSKGAVLLDVRTAEEYQKEHIDGAINLDYSEVALKAQELFPDKDRTIIVYCSAAKRSAQALASFIKLGYTNVYNLGSMQNYTVEPTLAFSGDTCRVITAGEKVGVNFTAGAGDRPQVYVSCGKDSTFEDALPIGEFTVPESDAYYLTLKAYLAYEGVCFAECAERFIYWSEKTVSAFAADLTWTKATIGWGSIRKDRSVDNHVLKLAGKTFAHGIGTHANSEISMQIPEGAKKFLAVGGCDLEMNGNYSTMMLFVKIDGVQVDQSSLIKVGQHYVFDVDIPEGAREILLYVYEGTYGGNSCDHADWCVAGFFDDPVEG